MARPCVGRMLADRLGPLMVSQRYWAWWIASLVVRSA